MKGLMMIMVMTLMTMTMMTADKSFGSAVNWLGNKKGRDQL